MVIFQFASCWIRDWIMRGWAKLTPPSHLWTAETQRQVEASQVIVEHEALAVVLSAGDWFTLGETHKKMWKTTGLVDVNIIFWWMCSTSANGLQEDTYIFFLVTKSDGFCFKDFDRQNPYWDLGSDTSWCFWTHWNPLLYWVFCSLLLDNYCHQHLYIISIDKWTNVVTKCVDVIIFPLIRFC
jgi:hypothetical protein